MVKRIMLSMADELFAALEKKRKNPEMMKQIFINRMSAYRFYNNLFG